MKYYFGFHIAIFIVIIMIMAGVNPLSAQQVNVQSPNLINIGSGRELFVDGYLVEKFSGKADFRLHHPAVQEIVMAYDAPWEGNTCVYHSIFKDGDIFRMYYRGSQIDVTKEKLWEAHPWVICYAESDDGIHWKKPNLGIHEFNGSKNNNIVLASGNIGGLQLKLSDNATIFKDENPNASPDARYKALVCSQSPVALYAFKSSDGIHWSPMSEKPIITKGAFDSQNVGFWDAVRGEYRAYWRYFKEATPENGLKKRIRAIRTAVSKDFIKWEQMNDVTYLDSSTVELYTNQVKAYYRAPQIFIGLPTRYIERGWSASMRALPQLEHRELRSSHGLRNGTALTDGMFMSSRDGVKFNLWSESFLRPGIERDGTWNYGQQYVGWHLIETKSDLKNAPNELSLYATENSWTDNSHTSDLRRYTLRLDGFVSVQAPMSGGELITRPLMFQGKELSLNFSTSAAGGIRIEIQDERGNPLPGFSLEDSSIIFGDAIDRTITWKNGSDVSSLVGKTVRLRFVLEDADLYSFQFQN